MLAFLIAATKELISTVSNAFLKSMKANYRYILNSFVFQIAYLTVYMFLLVLLQLDTFSSCFLFLSSFQYINITSIRFLYYVFLIIEASQLFLAPSLTFPQNASVEYNFLHLWVFKIVMRCIFTIDIVITLVINLCNCYYNLVSITLIMDYETRYENV